MKTKNGKSALKRVQKYFPQVERVRDSKRAIVVRVKPEDSVKGKKKDPGACALARACVREHIADAAIIGLGTSYLIKGKVATRYITSNAVGREITSFDRNQNFAPGVDYRLGSVCKTRTLGFKKTCKEGPDVNAKPRNDLVIRRTIHRTANVRTLKKP